MRVFMWTVIENKNEIVEAENERGESHAFFPEIDLDLSRKLLEQFNNVSLKGGRKLCEYWEYKGFYLFPAIQEWLYWHFFVQIVKHQKALSFLRGKKLSFKRFPYYTVSGVRKVWDVYYQRHSLLKRVFYNVCSSSLRFLSSFKPILVHDDGTDGFRYSKFKEVLSDFTEFTRIERVKKRNIVSCIRSWDHCIAGYKSVHYGPSPEISYDSCSFLHSYVSEDEFVLLIESIHRYCSDKVAESRILDKYLSKRNCRLLLGYDNIEEIASLVIACKLHGAKVITYQHGLFTRQHAGWLSPGISEKYCNVRSDKIVVWGKYWKEKLLKYSNIYQADNILLGAHLYDRFNCRCSHSRKRKEDALKIFLPYEFFTDNISVSRYIRKFLERGWSIIVKLRPVGNGNIHTDLYSYDEDIRERISFTYELLERDIEEIDVVVCTQTTFAFEMMRHSKPIWYLATRFHFLEMHEDGMAHYVDESILDDMKDRKILEKYLKPKHSFEQYEHVFNEESLKDSIESLLMKF